MLIKYINVFYNSSCSKRSSSSPSSISMPMSNSSKSNCSSKSVIIFFKSGSSLNSLIISSRSSVGKISSNEGSILISPSARVSTVDASSFVFKLPGSINDILSCKLSVKPSTFCGCSPWSTCCIFTGCSSPCCKPSTFCGCSPWSTCCVFTDCSSPCWFFSYCFIQVCCFTQPRYSDVFFQIQFGGVLFPQHSEILCGFIINVMILMLYIVCYKYLKTFCLNFFFS